MYSELVRDVFGIIGNVSGLLLFLAPTITFKKIICSKSTQEFSGIPYVVILLNCLITGWYGVISPDYFLVFTLNVVGATLQLIYVLIFVIFAPKREKAKILGLLTCVLALFGITVLISIYAFSWKGKRVFCGFAAVLSAIAMYASPLSATRLVIRTKSVEFMPFFLSLFVFMCGASWFIFGLLGNDPFLYVPNGLGTGLGIVQLILYAMYRNNKVENYKRSTNGSLEIGLSLAQQDKQLQSNLSPQRPI